MGGHSSRDALDVDLVRSEVEMLSSQFTFMDAVKEYGRMVDDISSIIHANAGFHTMSKKKNH